MALLDDPLPLENGKQSLATFTWRLLEFLGCLWATFVATEVGWVPLVFPRALVFAPYFIRLGENWVQVSRWSVVALWLLLDVAFLWRIWLSWWRLSWLRLESHEIALYAAALQPLRHPILRPLVASWWLGHFALAIQIGLVLENSFPMDPQVGLVIFMMFIFFAAYASNIFLIHAVTALTRGPAVQRVWNWRGVYDLGVVAAGVVWRLAARH